MTTPTEAASTPRTPTPELGKRFAEAGGKPTYVRQMFGRIARVYDLMNRLMTVGLDRRWRAFATGLIRLGPGQTGLDVGTGTGDLAIALASQSSPDARVIGVDFTPEMLDLAQRKIERLGLDGRVEVLHADGERLPFSDNSFDACCSAFVVRNLSDMAQGFSEMLRVVKPGGQVVCLEMSHPYNPIFSAGYHLYFDRIVPLLGKLIGKAFDAYSYLPSSVVTFPPAPELRHIMEAAGWTDVRYYYRLGGVVAIHTGVKPVATQSPR